MSWIIGLVVAGLIVGAARYFGKKLAEKADKKYFNKDE